MSLRSNLFFRLAYLVGFKPWDSGVPRPELVEVVEGPRRLPPGRALDLGCGTGTTSIYMASKSWQVTGVDFVPKAIATARARAAAAGTSATFIVGDVTRLHELGLTPGYDLLLDQGCFHSLPAGMQPAYVTEIAAMARPGATYLLFAFGPHAGARRPFFPQGVSPQDVRRIFAGFEVIEPRPGSDPFGGHWYTMRRR